MNRRPRPIRSRQNNKKVVASMTSAIASEAAANWVITGGCGFIGRSLVARLLKAGVPSGRIRIVDNLSVGTLQDLEAAVQVRSGSAGWTAANDGAALHVADIRDGAAIKEIGRASCRERVCLAV